MNIKNLLITSALVVGFSTAAQAGEAWPAWYVGLHGDVQFTDDSDVNVVGGGSGEIEYHTGYALGGALGYNYTDNIRAELEYSHRWNKLDVVAGNNAGGGQKVQLYTANVYYDFKDPMLGGFVPYVGAGAGAATVDLTSGVLRTDDKDTVFAYQFKAGLSYESDLIEDAVWGLGYRYVGTSDPELETSTNQKVDHEYDSHSIEANVRFLF